MGATGQYLTENLPGIGGVIKEQLKDFFVEELPLYAPEGVGDHTFFEIEKTGLSTFQAVRNIARALHVSPYRIGYAGLKDAQAITRQVLSVDAIPPETVAGLELPHIRVTWVKRHPRRLKIGHLHGNRFAIRIRAVEPQALPTCQAILDLLSQRGVPNRFGPQRFGQRGDSAQLGRAMVQKDIRGFIQGFLGGPHPNESPRVQSARAQFDAGQWEKAQDLFPGSMADEHRALETLLRTKGDYEKAYGSLPKRLRVFLLSAYQSALFNRVLNARLQSLDRVDVGDVAVKHPGQSVFLVQDAGVEQVRADRFEISPTGPLFGFKMMQASGRQGVLERQVLISEGVTLDDFRVGEGIKAKGARRALRFQVNSPSVDYDDGLVLRFWLPKGCYATALLAEIMKVPLVQEPYEDEM
jgi:tRNA pseudouridine13 synthase